MLEEALLPLFQEESKLSSNTRNFYSSFIKECATFIKHVLNEIEGKSKFTIL